MSETKVNDFMGNNFEKVKSMINVDNVMGTPITTADGTTIIPVCKVNYGVAGGGSDLPTKTTKELFGGGSGAAVTITPVAFLIIKDGNARVVQIEPFTSSVDRAIQMVPEVAQKVTDFIKDKSKPETSEI